MVHVTTECWLDRIAIDCESGDLEPDFLETQHR